LLDSNKTGKADSMTITSVVLTSYLRQDISFMRIWKYTYLDFSSNNAKS